MKKKTNKSKKGILKIFGIKKAYAYLDSSNKLYSPAKHGHLLLSNKPHKKPKTGENLITGKTKFLPKCTVGSKDNFESSWNTKSKSKYSIQKERYIKPFKKLSKKYPGLYFLGLPGKNDNVLDEKADFSFKNLNLPKTSRRKKCWQSRHEINPFLRVDSKDKRIKGAIGTVCINDEHCKNGLECSNNLGGFKRGTCQKPFDKKAKDLPDNSPCKKNLNCKSKKCGKRILSIGIGKCMPTNLDLGKNCYSNDQCKTNYCKGSILGAKGTCSDIKKAVQYNTVTELKLKDRVRHHAAQSRGIGEVVIINGKCSNKSKPYGIIFDKEVNKLHCYGEGSFWKLEKID